MENRVLRRSWTPIAFSIVQRAPVGRRSGFNGLHIVLGATPESIGTQELATSRQPNVGRQLNEEVEQLLFAEL